MKTFVHVAFLLILVWLLPSMAAAQEGKRYPTFRDLDPSERLHYNESPAEILPDAKVAFEKGDYERSIMLCSMHWAYYGDSTEDLVERQQLEAKAKKCFDLSREMKDLITERKLPESKLKAREILDINPKDQDALTVWNFTVKVTGVAVSPSAVSIEVGKTFQLTAKVSPADAENKSVLWVSGDGSIATVNQNGLVKAENPGRVMITVITKDGDFMGTSIVTVNAEPESTFEPKPEADKTVERKPESGLVNVTGVELSKKSLFLEKGHSGNLSAKVYPDNAANKSVVWSFGDRSIATVDGNGKVTAVGPGRTAITAITFDGNFTDTCMVVVFDKSSPLEVSSVEISKKTLSLQVGETYLLSAKVYPDKAVNKSVSWTQGDGSVAIVDGRGNVKAVGPGTTIIIVKTDEGYYADTCTVAVPEKPEPIKVTGVKINKKGLTMQVGETARLSAKVHPDNAANKSVVWSYNDRSVATVDGNGKVTAVGSGSTFITVMTLDGCYTDSCTVTVISPKQ